MNGDKKVFGAFVFFILHASLADFFQTSTAVCSFFIITVFTIFPLLTHGLQAYPVAIARLIGAFYPDKTCLSIIAFGGWGVRGGGSSMTLLVRLLFVRDIRGVYDQSVGVLHMKREFRAIHPFLQFSSFTSSLFNSTPLLRGKELVYKYIDGGLLAAEILARYTASHYLGVVPICMNEGVCVFNVEKRRIVYTLVHGIISVNNGHVEDFGGEITMSSKYSIMRAKTF